MSDRSTARDFPRMGCNGFPRLARDGVRLTAAAVLAVIGVLLAASAASAQGTIPPEDGGRLFIEAWGAGPDPSGTIGNGITLTITSPCLTGPVTAGINTSDTFAGDGFSGSTFVDFDVIEDAAGNPCVFTLTAPDIPGKQLYPSTPQTFSFTNGPFADAGVELSWLEDDAFAPVVVGMQAWDITDDEYESGSWPSSSTWTFDNAPTSWPYEITSPCLAAPIIVEAPVVTTGPTFRSFVTSPDLPIFSGPDTLCEYTTTAMPPPGWVVAPSASNPPSQTDVMIPRLVAEPSFLIVRDACGYAGCGADPGIVPARVEPVGLAGGSTVRTPAIVLLGLGFATLAMATMRRRGFHPLA